MNKPIVRQIMATCSIRIMVSHVDRVEVGTEALGCMLICKHTAFPSQCHGKMSL